MGNLFVGLKILCQVYYLKVVFSTRFPKLSALLPVEFLSSITPTLVNIYIVFKLFQMIYFLQMSKFLKRFLIPSIREADLFTKTNTKTSVYDLRAVHSPGSFQNIYSCFDKNHRK